MNKRSTIAAVALAFALTACSSRVSVPAVEVEPVESTRPLTIDDVSAAAVNAEPTASTLRSTSGPVIVRAQVLLDRAQFSVGVIDGNAGRNTELALLWFQKTHNLPATSTLDSATYTRLMQVAGAAPAVMRFVVDEKTLEGPFIVLPRNVYEQAKLRCLCYASLTEKLAERFHATLEVMRKLNPGIGFAALKPGDTIWVPAVEVPTSANPVRVARIQVAKRGSYVHAYDRSGRLVYHFPSTLGSRYDPSPTGNFKVTGVAWDPVFRYDPTLFSDVADNKPGAKLPPGPNSPVGRVWIALSRDHIGIHGTPTPETIGFASSHGCVRLTNWDATKLARAASRGTRVDFTS